jgi:hypothetical protein
MRDAIQVVKIKPITIKHIDRASCQPGTSNGNRTIMATGAVNGITESQNARLRQVGN